MRAQEVESFLASLLTGVGGSAVGSASSYLENDALDAFQNGVWNSSHEASIQALGVQLEQAHWQGSSHRPSK